MTNHYNQNLKIKESIPILPPGELASNILHVFCALISEKTFSCTEQTSMKVYCFGAWFSVILFILYKCFPSISHNNSPSFPRCVSCFPLDSLMLPLASSFKVLRHFVLDKRMHFQVVQRWASCKISRESCKV